MVALSPILRCSKHFICCKCIALERAETIKISHGSDRYRITVLIPLQIMMHDGSCGSSELHQHGPNKRPFKSTQRPTTFYSPQSKTQLICAPLPFTIENSINPQKRHNIMRLINLHIVLIALVASSQAAASLIPAEERGTYFPYEIFMF